MRTSSMSAGTSPVRFTASATTVLPSLTASTLRKARPYLPTGVRQAPADADPWLVGSGGRVDEADELPWGNRAWPRNVDRAAMGRRRADERQHRLRRVVDQDELVRSVGIQRPSATPSRQRSLEDGPI